MASPKTLPTRMYTNAPKIYGKIVPEQLKDSSIVLLSWIKPQTKSNELLGTRKPASRVFLAPPQGLAKFLSFLCYAWQLLSAKFFDLVKLEFWTPGPRSLGVRGQIWLAYSVLRYMKVKRYQFSLATISGFQDHLEVTRIRTNRNQLVSIYLISL